MDQWTGRGLARLFPSPRFSSLFGPCVAIQRILPSPITAVNLQFCLQCQGGVEQTIKWKITGEHPAGISTTVWCDSNSRRARQTRLGLNSRFILQDVKHAGPPPSPSLARLAHSSYNCGSPLVRRLFLTTAASLAAPLAHTSTKDTQTVSSLLNRAFVLEH